MLAGNSRRLTYAGLELGQRLQRRPNDHPAWRQILVKEKTQDFDPMFDQCWPSVYDAGPTPTKHWAEALRLSGGSYTPPALGYQRGHRVNYHDNHPCPAP